MTKNEREKAEKVFNSAIFSAESCIAFANIDIGKSGKQIIDSIRLAEHCCGIANGMLIILNLGPDSKERKRLDQVYQNAENLMNEFYKLH